MARLSHVAGQDGRSPERERWPACARCSVTCKFCETDDTTFLACCPHEPRRVLPPAKTILRCSPARYRKSIPAPSRILVLAGTMLRPDPRREQAKARVHRARWRRGCLRSTTMVRGAEAEPTNARDL